MTRAIEPWQARTLRLCSQRLLPSRAARSVPDAVRSSAGLQAQSWPAAILGVRPRSSDLVAEDVERARVEERSVVRSWFMRGTLHLVPAEDAGWLLGLLGPIVIAAYSKRRADLGLDEATYAQAARVVDEALSEGPLTRTELGQALVQAGVGIDVKTQALAHLTLRAALEGRVCYGPSQGRDMALVRLRDWIDPGPALEPDVAAAELAGRYLAAFGPAAPSDFAKWSGLPMPAARTAFAALPDLAEVTVDGAPGWLPAAALTRLADLRTAERSVVRLLGAFDTYLLGHADRTVVVDAGLEQHVWHGGIIEPVALADGRVIARWKAARTGRATTVELRPFSRLDATAVAAVDEEAADLGRFLGVTTSAAIAEPLL